MFTIRYSSRLQGFVVTKNGELCNCSWYSFASEWDAIDAVREMDPQQGEELYRLWSNVD